MYNRPLIGFLILNFILAIAIIVMLNNKQNNYNPIRNEVINQPTANITQPVNQPATPLAAASAVKQTDSTSLCMIYGPMGIEQKATLDTIITQEKLTSQTVIDKKAQYEIVWNLGKDKEQASQMFARQKAGPLQDDKFRLSNIDGMWMVSIATVSDNAQSAKLMAEQLGEKADKVNAGGKWQYRSVPDAYFFQIKDINALTSESLNQINNGMNLSKKPCLS